MLKVQGLNAWYDRSHVVQDITFEVHRGEIVTLMGRNGAGKTTTLRTLMGLRDLGNTVLVVEHDEETIRSADWILDLGPGAGEHGGWLVAEGTVSDILANPASLTGDYLSGRRCVPIPEKRRNGNGKH